MFFFEVAYRRQKFKGNGVAVIAEPVQPRCALSNCIINGFIDAKKYKTSIYTENTYATCLKHDLGKIITTGT